MSKGVLLNTFLEKIIHADIWLFKKINTDWANSFFDAVFPVWRHSDTWLPLYLFLFVFMILNYGWRSLPWMLALGITAGICDQVSSSFIKDAIGRVRPCREETLIGQANLLLVHCPSSGSFTSSHATNHFGVATFIFYTLHKSLRPANWLFFAWAATICYGQVYVGVHYPADVAGGAVLGFFIGLLMASFFNSQTKWTLKEIEFNLR